jgi:hypothetical protein
MTKQQQLYSCVYCGGSFLRSPEQRKTKSLLFCSLACQQEYRKRCVKPEEPPLLREFRAKLARETDEAMAALRAACKASQQAKQRGASIEELNRLAVAYEAIWWRAWTACQADPEARKFPGDPPGDVGEPITVIISDCAATTS